MLNAVFLSRVNERHTLLEKHKRRIVSERFFVGNKERGASLVVILQKTKLYIIVGINVFLAVDLERVIFERASALDIRSKIIIAVVLTARDGSLSAYFTVQNEPAPKSKPAKTICAAARFPDRGTLKRCCGLLREQQDAILSSRLYEYRRQYVLSLKLKRAGAMPVQHLLSEYGRPFRLSPLNRARLAEYGSCICEQNALNY